MKTSRIAASLGILTVLLCVPVSLHAKKRLSDYSMRIHVYQTQWTRTSWGFRAFGRANLFDEQGVPHGVAFRYDCGDHLMASSGDEAYPAKWKKKGQSIDVVFGEIGANPNSIHDCEFKITEQQSVYYRDRGGVETESAQDFMAKNPHHAPKVGPATQGDVPFSANPRFSR